MRSYTYEEPETRPKETPGRVADLYRDPFTGMEVQCPDSSLQGMRGVTVCENGKPKQSNK